MENQLVTQEALGQQANLIAARYCFEDYRSRRASNTIRRQDAGLALFGEYLSELDILCGDLSQDPSAWRAVTWGLVEGFARWMLHRSYSIGTINLRLSTIKTYAKLAFKAGVLSQSEQALIANVFGYSHKEGQRIDEAREKIGMAVRVGNKKAECNLLTKEQADRLKQQPDTPQGKRDRLLMCILLDLGLRASEVANLKTDQIDDDTITFYRQKVNRTQTLRLTPDTLAALDDYPLQNGALIRASKKDGQLLDKGMSARAISARVQHLGYLIGVAITAHDCRHYWATRAARCGTPLDRLQDAGGWSSMAMPLRYIEAAEIANEGVNLQ